MYLEINDILCRGVDDTQAINTLKKLLICYRTKNLWLARHILMVTY